ncbi:MAG: SRPBCC domain-containing protein [Pseudonocardiaceae bacterium]
MGRSATWTRWVLESQPHRRLSYSWHNYQPEHAELFGWTGEVFAELVKEKRSKVTFEIESVGSMVKLTVSGSVSMKKDQTATGAAGGQEGSLDEDRRGRWQRTNWLETCHEAR